MDFYIFKVLDSVSFYMEYGLEGSEGVTDDQMKCADEFLKKWMYCGLENYEDLSAEDFGKCEVTGVLGNRVRVNFTKIQEESDSDSE